MAAVRRCEQEADYTTAGRPVIKCCAWGGRILCSRSQSHRLLDLQTSRASCRKNWFSIWSRKSELKAAE